MKFIIDELIITMIQLVTRSLSFTIIIFLIQGSQTRFFKSISLSLFHSTDKLLFKELIIRNKIKKITLQPDFLY